MDTVELEIRPVCARCAEPLPAAHEGQPVLGVPGVGTFHAHCEPTRHQRVWHWLYRHFAPKPRGRAIMAPINL